MKGADAFLACLRAEGIKYIFGNPGTTEIPLLDALSATADITYMITLHESVAVGMADGYARSGGKIGFVSVHTAAGTSNCIGGIYNAYIEKSPIIITAGCKDTRLLGRDCFSEVPDFAGLPRQFTKLSWSVLRSDRIVENLLHGIKTAVTPPCGPVFMTFCEDLLDQEVEFGEVVSQIPKSELTFSGDQQAIQEAARLLSGAKAPLLIAGSEIAKGDALGDAVALAELLGLPVMTEGRNSLSSLNFPHTHPAFRGSFEAKSAYVRKADVVLGIGCKMFTQVSYSHEPDIPVSAKIIHFHSESHELARLYSEEVSVLTDAKKGILDLIEALKPLLTPELKKDIKERAEQLKIDADAAMQLREEEMTAAWDKQPIQLPRLIRELQNALPKDAIIVDESTRSSRALLKYFNFEQPGTYLRSSAGVLGWGTPAALGVKLANPDRQVVAFVGDGSFTFTLQGLWTAAKYNIPVVVIICNNRQYRAVKEATVQYKGIAARTGNFVATDLTGPNLDYCQVAQGFGVWAKKVTLPDDIKGVLAEALLLGKPAVIEVALT